MIDTPTVIPNHHGQDPPFRGFKEYLAAATMIFGRGGDARLAERLSELKADDAVVDVGCGPGTAVRHAATLASTVVGVDPAPEELRVARLLTRLSEIRYSRTRNSERVRYLPGTAEEIRPKDQGAKHPRTGGRFAPQPSARWGSTMARHPAATVHLMGASEEIDAPDALETETCAGCGLTVEVDSPVFLEWDADIVGFSACPDCRPTTACGNPEETPRRRAA